MGSVGRTVESGSCELTLQNRGRTCPSTVLELLSQRLSTLHLYQKDTDSQTARRPSTRRVSRRSSSLLLHDLITLRRRSAAPPTPVPRPSIAHTWSLQETRPSRHSPTL